jgi:phenylpropionate dioxygenase-like ring-hydroxylating dioxygenase large terminal subunit
VAIVSGGAAVGVPRWGEGTDESRRIGTSRLGEPEIYTDPEHLVQERETVFRFAWHIAGRAEAIPKPGDYLVWERFGQSVVIARQADGSLGAFYNVCPHRGARIVAEGGHCDSGELTCPFHGFGYDLRGDLIRVPERGTFDPKHLAGLRTAEVAVDVWDGWLCVHLDPEHAKPLSEELGELTDELGWYGMGDWKYYGSSRCIAEANWKTVLEGFLETWHVASVHAKTLPEGIDVSATTYASFAPHSMMVIPIGSKRLQNAPQPVVHQALAICHYLVFPCAFFNMYPDQGYLTTVYPIDEKRTLLEGYVVARKTPPKGMDPEKWDASVASSLCYMDEIVDEDRHVAGEIGAVRHSFGYQGNLYNRLECRITEFHRELGARLRSGTTSPR